MNAERLLTHYGQIADAPHAIAGCRLLDAFLAESLAPVDAREMEAAE